MMSLEHETNEKTDKELILTCDSKTIKKDEEVSCTLKGNVSDYDVSSLSSTIEKNNDYELIEVIPDSSWEGDGENGDIDLYTDNNKSDKFGIVTFKIKLLNDENDNIQINIIENIFFDQDFNRYDLSNVTTKLKIER